MTQITLSKHNIKVLKMLKSSMMIETHNKSFFVTRRVFNILITSDECIIALIIQKEFNGNTMEWLALPSIF